MRVELNAFEERYRDVADPWDFVTSPYENRKYDITVAELPRARYRRCFEPGCAVGALTARLASVCDEVVAQEASASALATARTNLDRSTAEPSNVSLVHGAVPETWPAGTFDLVVFSELGYYWDEPALIEIVDRVWSLVESGGDLIAVHWRGHSPDHLLSGDVVHDILRRRLGPSLVHHIESDFVLDVWSAL